jgi:hypothetical protein
MALMPVAIALALDLFAAVEPIANTVVAASLAGAFFGLAMLCWYALAWLSKRKNQPIRRHSWGKRDIAILVPPASRDMWVDTTTCFV